MKLAKIELTTYSINEDYLLDNNQKDEVVNNDDEENIKLENKKIDEINEIERKDEKKRILPKFRFIDFLCNNLYSSKICKSSKRQEIISKCNKIIAKYNSIETILYNQIKMENLLKDYKWNNKDLEDINNNELIFQLSNLISSYNT